MNKRKWAAALMSMALATAMISGCSVIKEETSQSIYQPQINPLAGCICCLISIKLFHKKLRSRQTKTVNALFKITYNEKIESNFFLHSNK